MHIMCFAKPIKEGRAQTLLSRNLQFSEGDACKTDSDIKHNMVKTICDNVRNIKHGWVESRDCSYSVLVWAVRRLLRIGDTSAKTGWYNRIWLYSRTWEWGRDVQGKQCVMMDSKSTAYIIQKYKEMMKEKEIRPRS